MVELILSYCVYRSPQRVTDQPVQIVHIFRVYFPPAQRRVRLSPIESFVLNAATAADEQQRPRKINSCFYKTPESHRPVQTSARREIVHISQWIACWAHNPEVPGSGPGGATMLKCARFARGRASRHTLLYITITDYCNLGNTAGFESGLKTRIRCGFPSAR